MRLKVQKLGSSAIIRLPIKVLKKLNIKIGDVLLVNLNDHKLKLHVQKPKYKLADLVLEMDESFPIIEEWESMPSVGKEII